MAPEGTAPAGDTSWFAREVSPRLCDLAVALGGAFGAAYGIGVVTLDLLDRSRDPAKRVVMGAVKAALDPKAILNRGREAVRGKNVGYISLTSPQIGSWLVFSS